jgi:hypothetical protein
MQIKIIETDFAAFIFRLLGFIASQIRETKIQKVLVSGQRFALIFCPKPRKAGLISS